MTAQSDETEQLHQAQKLLKIALVDDHELLLGSLAQALGDKPQVAKVAIFHKPESLIQDLDDSGEYDLVVTDLLMGKTSGLALAKELQSRFQTPVLLMSGVEAPPAPEEMERNGIGGFVHKTAPIDVLEEAILAVSSGKPYFRFPDGWDQGEGAQKFGRQGAEDSEWDRTAMLSERQVEVIKLVASGASNKEIASKLGITENTVKTHLKQIFSSLGVTKRTACVQAAQSRGLLE